MLAEGNLHPLRSPEDHRLLILVEFAPGPIDVETVGAADFVESVGGHLRVDDVSVGTCRNERAIPQTLGGIGDQELRVDAFFKAEAAAGGTGPVLIVEAEGAAGQGRKLFATATAPALEARDFIRTRTSAARAALDAEAREEQTQILAQLGEGGHRRARTLHRRTLVDGDARPQPFDGIDAPSASSAKEASQPGRQGAEHATLGLAVNRLESQRGLPRSRDPGDHDQPIVGQVQIKALEIVGARSAQRQS